MDPGKQIEVDGGRAGLLRVRVIPRTSIALSATPQKLAALSTKITLSGSVLNLPDGTDVRFTWIVQRGSERTSYPVAGVKLKVQGKTQGSVTVKLDVIDHGLVGQGSVGFEISPDFPYCPAQAVEPGPITFDNPLAATFSGSFFGGLSGQMIGSVITVHPQIGAVFRDTVVKLTIRERDEGDTERAVTDDMAHEILWGKGEVAAKPWRIGCKSADGVVFDYPEEAERGAYEFDYTLSVSRDDGKKFATLYQSGQILTVPHPKLESFELVVQSSDAWNSGLFDYMGRTFSNWSREDAQKVMLKVMRARGRLTGYDSDIQLPIQLSLWMTDPEGKTTQFKSSKAAEGVEHTVLLHGDGSFDEELVNFCELTNEEDWAKINKATFFIVLRLPPAVTGTKDRTPLYRIFDYDCSKLAPFHEGEHVGVLKGTGVCTPRLDGKEARPVCVDKYASVYNDHEQRLKGMKIELDDGKKRDLATFVKGWEANKARYDKVAKETDVPAALIAAIHWRESGGNFGTYLHQGDPLGKPPVHVPTNIPTFYKWEDAAIHAISMNHHVAVNVALTRESKDWAKMATFAEFYNGLGYHNNGHVSPYVYSGTSCYTGGKYVRDGEFDAKALDAQLGVVVLLDSSSPR